ncbi:hypothetical protein PoB_001352700 [Plakobranchus ocellatus]|uniref:Uncharacterized protein n=1 Tax=Plakobranchus ocellatus TaxID=259542 RepID=A0AAV3YXU5_9GAST|nr:hypothetical protein PoB_001352700 [Plakobranchus ocellatus]
MGAGVCYRGLLKDNDYKVSSATLSTFHPPAKSKTNGLSGPPSGQDNGGGARTRDRRVPVDLRADSLSTLPPKPPEKEVVDRKKREKEEKEEVGGEKAARADLTCLVN